MNQNGKHSDITVLDVIDDHSARNQTNPDSNDASNDDALKPAREIVVKTRGWKRKLISSCLILFLIGGGAVALYLLLRINRVNVRVQTDSRRNAQDGKAPNESNNSENGLTADAINIARAAAGTDTDSSNTAASSVSSQHDASLSADAKQERNLNLGTTSPVFAQLADTASTNGNSIVNSNSPNTEPTNQPTSTNEIQSHANPTQSIFVDDQPVKTLSQPGPLTPIERKPKNNSAKEELIKTSSVLPSFGTMLPVRTQGVVFSLRNNSYARLELTRDSSGAGWSLPKGTVLIGRTSGSEFDRAFVSVIGFIDPRENNLVKLTGEVLGNDGASGIPGERIGADRNRFKQTLRKVATSGVHAAGMLAGALGRGPVVIDGAGYRLLNPLSDEARNLINDNKRTFVKVEAGRAAYVMVTDLPKSVQGIDAPGGDEIARAAVSLTDQEVMALILFGSSEEIRAALPLMTDQQKQLALKSLPAENEKR